VDPKKIGYEVLDWINLAQEKHLYRAFGNMVVTYKMLGIAWVAEKLLAFQEVLNPMELVSNPFSISKRSC
jgi:hypothetical protein